MERSQVKGILTLNQVSREWEKTFVNGSKKEEAAGFSEGEIRHTLENQGYKKSQFNKLFSGLKEDHGERFTLFLVILVGFSVFYLPAGFFPLLLGVHSNGYVLFGGFGLIIGSFLYYVGRKVAGVKVISLHAMLAPLPALTLMRDCLLSKL